MFYFKKGKETSTSNYDNKSTLPAPSSIVKTPRPYNQNVNKNKIKTDSSTKVVTMNTRLKLRNQKLIKEESGGSKSKIMRFDSKKGSTDSSSIDINVDENKIEIHDEEIDNEEDEVDENEVQYSNPLNWTINDVCDYLINNNLNDNRIFQLLKENVSYFVISLTNSIIL
jgi:hypothetical protein